jgi:hypothetical protein
VDLIETLDNALARDVVASSLALVSSSVNSERSRGFFSRDEFQWWTPDGLDPIEGKPAGLRLWLLAFWRWLASIVSTPGPEN